MNKLTKDEVKHIAHLARIQLADAEIEDFQEQLTSVIEYNVNLLSEVKVEGVEPTSQTTGLQNVWREDVVASSLPVEVAVSEATKASNNQFVVKKVLGES
jgi:aspartyl-tRNA(Asn)/glutamyl-tRNA(Gln) amidotransferase subunit C